MTRIEVSSFSRGLAAALAAGLAATFLFATPAQAQRTSLDSLATDHTGLAADHDDIQATVEETNQMVKEGPTQVFDCMTIDTPGAYVVVQNIVASGDCFRIEALNVTLNLGGFEISGDGTGFGILTGNAGRRGLTVHHGTVTGFSVGVALISSLNCVIRNVRANNNTNDGISGGASCVYRDNTANDNGGNGIITDGGLLLGGSNLFTGNTAHRNGGIGILVFNFGSVVTGNAAGGNGGGGIFVNGGTVGGNTAQENTGNGLEIDGTSTVFGNTSRGNSGFGLRVSCPSNVFDNTVVVNTGGNLSLNEFSGACLTSNNLAP